jgi:hypothetical protein
MNMFLNSEYFSENNPPNKNTKYEVLMVMIIKITVPLDITHCSQVKRCQCLLEEPAASICTVVLPF